MSPRHQSPRRLLVLFVAVTVLPSAALAWLGWQFVIQDRALQDQRVDDLLRSRATTISAAIERELTRFERDLSSWLGAGAASLPVETALAVRLTRTAVASHAGAPLLYVPAALAGGMEPPESLWADAERLEFVTGDLPGAARVYRALAASADAAARAGALIRLARVQARMRQMNLALSTYAAMTSLTRARVDGHPADLLARWGRVELLATLGRVDAHRSEAEALTGDLLTGRWAIDGTTYQFYASTLGLQDSEPVRVSTALAEVVVVAWSESQSSPGGGRRGRRSVGTAAGPVLLIWRQNGESVDVFAAMAGDLARVWSPIWSAPDVTLALIDDDSQAVIGQRLPDGPRTITAESSETGLPWTIRVAAAGVPSELASAGRTRRRLVIAGLAVLAFLLPASAYLVSRAVQRELAVARQQADFVSAVSHEFRSPLTSLTHMTSLLRRDFRPSDERRREYYDVLARETDRLRRFVETLLDFGRMRAGATRYRLVPLDVAVFLQGVVEEFRRDTASSGRPVSCTTPEPLPRIAADAEALGRAVWNLLENAVKYSPEGTAVAVRAEGADGRIAIRVRDSGAGIPEAEQPFVFQQFYRGETAIRSAVKGTGVGLAVVDHIVRGHGGEITLESRPGAGSTFTILLPAAQDVRREAVAT